MLKPEELKEVAEDWAAECIHNVEGIIMDIDLVQAVEFGYRLAKAHANTK